MPDQTANFTATPLPDAPSLERDERVSLEDVRRPVETDLAEFRRHFRDSLNTPVGLLDKITRYILRQKGKEVRPLLVLLSAKACGKVGDTTYRAAALVELLHTATLVHDDVVDDADTRRGVFSIRALWQDKVAVLFGDFLLSRGLLLSLQHGDYDMLHTLSDAVRRMSEGELLQIQKTRLLNIDEETYFQIISDKTASLISACARCGALSATDNDTLVERMREAGEALGLAFQIRDDLFDYGLSDAGKPIGIDLQEKKLTLPLIAALREAGWWKRQRMRALVLRGNKSREDLERVRDFVTEHDGLHYARRKMREHARRAADLFAELPPTPARAALLDLAAFTVQREK